MTKYKFNPETLSYEKDKTDFKTRLRVTLVVLPACLFISVIFVFTFLSFYSSPRLQEEMERNDKLLAQYKLMSKKIDGIQDVLSDLQDRDDNLYRVVFEADPISSSVRMAGFGGVNRYEELEKLDDTELVRNTAEKLDIVTKQAFIQSKSYAELADKAKEKEKMLSSIPAIMPVANKDLKRTASGWGYRIHPVYKIKRFHEGMDFTAPIGTNVYTTGDGVVSKVETRSSGYGKYVVIDHGFGYETLYAHMSSFSVEVGDKVKRGNVIGAVGNTGTSTGAHLHYEVHRNGIKVNPQHYYFKDLNAEEYEQMVAISNNVGQTLD